MNKQHLKLQENAEIYNPDPKNYSKLVFGTWDKDEILTFMSNSCKGALETYGLMRGFVDTSNISKVSSALVFYYCLRDGSGSGVIVSYIQRDKNNKIISTHRLLTESDSFNLEKVEVKYNEIFAQFNGFSSKDVGNCCRDVIDYARIYFEGETPRIEFLTKNDYRL
jgi:hypothetical protein